MGLRSLGYLFCLESPTTKNGTFGGLKNVRLLGVVKHNSNITLRTAPRPRRPLKVLSNR